MSVTSDAARQVCDDLPSPSLWADAMGAVALVPIAASLGVGIAAASGVPPMAGLVSAIIGGLVVGSLSRSSAGISSAAAGLQSAVVGYVALAGSFEAFLLTLLVAGLLQIFLGLVRVGSLASFIPSNVIYGLLAAIGLMLILKQIPHILGHDTDPEGEMSFFQPDKENTFSEFGALLDDMHPGAAAIGIASVTLLVLWEWGRLDRIWRVSGILFVVPLGMALHLMFDWMGSPWAIEESHLIQIPVLSSWSELTEELRFPDFRQWENPVVYTRGLALGLLATLETLLNSRGIDKLDPLQRQSPADAGLVALGIGNCCAGLLGGLPLTVDVVPNAIALKARGLTRLVAIFLGGLLLLSLWLLPRVVNFIPMASVAAVLLTTGVQMFRGPLLRQIWRDDKSQLVPFACTLAAIIVTDLPTGTFLGLAISVGFLLQGNFKRPVRSCVEQHLGTEVLHVEFGEQVSFLNRAAVDAALRAIPRGGHVFLDAANTVYIDPDMLSLIRDYRDRIAPAHGVSVSLKGFNGQFGLRDEIHFVEYSTRELQQQSTPEEVLRILLEGNERFRTGQCLTRDHGRILHATAQGQHPMAVVLSCIDSRTPAEIIFDLGLGDVFSIRVAGNISSPKVLGSVEYSCAVAGARLVLVIGHTNCGAVTSAVKLACSSESAAEATGCDHLQVIVDDIQRSIEPGACRRLKERSGTDLVAFVNDVARRNVLLVVDQILAESGRIRKLAAEGRVLVLGAIYDVTTGMVEILGQEPGSG